MMRLKPSLPPVGFSKVLETFKIKQIEIWQVWLDRVPCILNIMSNN